jgi:hypothetical protein
MRARRKIAEANSTALLQHSLPFLEEVAAIMGGLSPVRSPVEASEAAAFVHMVMMSNNGDPADPERRRAVLEDGVRRYNEGRLRIEKRGGILEMYIATK